MKRRSRFVAGFFALLGMIAVVSLFSPTTYFIDAFEVRLSLQIFDRGETQLAIPPIGRISARTHLTPLRFKAALQSIDLDLLRKISEEIPSREAVLGRVEQMVIRVARRFMARVLVLAALGGAVGVLAVGRRRPVALLKGALVGTVSMGILLGASLATYDRKAFLRPEYQGVLEAAPWMVSLFEESLVKVRVLGEQLAIMSGNLFALFGRIDRLQPLGALQGELKILAISDLHNNPAAISFISEIVDVFDVDLILDAGDLTDFGTALETRLISPMGRFKVPHVVAAGNHDALAVRRQLVALPNVIYLTGEEVRVKGLRIIGDEDPAALNNSPALAPAEAYRDLEDRLRARIRPEDPPDVLVVHNPQVAHRFIGVVPLIIYGHTHTLAVKEEPDGTVMINPGTTGGAGIRGLQAQREIPYSLVLIRMETVGGRLRPAAADSVRVFNIRSGFTLERTLFGPWRQRDEGGTGRFSVE